VNTEIY